MVRRLANKRDCAEYDIFQDAFDEWNRAGVYAAFVRYILEDVIPWWVTDYCRKNLNEGTHHETNR